MYRCVLRGFLWRVGCCCRGCTPEGVEAMAHVEGALFTIREGYQRDIKKGLRCETQPLRRVLAAGRVYFGSVENQWGL